MNEKEKFSQRLNKALDDYGAPLKGKGRQSWVAKHFQVSPKGARKWLEGEGFPKTENFIQIAHKLSVSEEWLRTGVINGNSSTQLSLDSDEKNLIKNYRELSLSLRKALVTIFQELTKK